ncbi:efflux RND transporter periplasmic adaptor subunit [Halomonas pacifica]|uniref:efflux RND transporter periplasmic adaptor subunit n=1 Tax=Bisbaumannia pacifica TaxID=77098 RepID=UPI0023594403|nr:efflux RND transporter periplasmic adaptor subunit [Halomonas pacifica]MDC8802251.1 efflux RND transporter periplasmic adaptor subunit [Halomonas pacifica]
MTPTQRRLRRLALALIALALVALLAWALRPAPPAVNTALVSRGPFEESVREEGRTQLRDSYAITAPIAGYLRRVELEVGDPVAAGQPLFYLEPSPAPALDARARRQAEERLQAARARWRAAQARLEQQQAARRFGDAEYQRQARLQERQLVSPTELERYRSERDRQRALERAAQAEVEAARSELAGAQAALSVVGGQREGATASLAVPSPIDGRVMARQRCCEGSVREGEPILTLGRLADLEVRVDLLSMEAVRLRPGMAVRLLAWGGEPLPGRVRRIEPSGFTRLSALGVEEQRVPVIVDFAAGVDPTVLGLGSGFRVEAEFLLWEDDATLQLPTSALFRQQGEWSVFRVEGERIHLHRVTPGRRSGLTTQLLEGLAEGERVVIHPGERLDDGLRVRLDD